MKKIIVTAPARRRENSVVALVAMASPRKISRMKAAMSARLPMSPNSSE
ncbi:Uncharacterised protein [Mycobacterium tuberculosis]|nr:Uncharacterised protein [Mycobacterium tuberculosis]